MPNFHIPLFMFKYANSKYFNNPVQWEAVDSPVVHCPMKHSCLFKSSRYETYTISRIQDEVYVMRKCKLFIGCIGILFSWGMRNKVPRVWPLIRSECPRVRTLNLTRITSCSQWGNMCHGKNRRSLEMRRYYFSSCCHVSITCSFIRMKREAVIYHCLKGTT